ncbi:uncharacterized protein LOC34617460 [Cyclospora cayetanensis]|uniref:Uncharacterized protein LOC34617460 n=1 Tax=Cyclospora cayetanensis TaxID=88456 RepID=A0A6P6S2K8_9EIME|nr:uncharacterized protein LOC34617460 [Cyclospora cayetanensis]
MQHAETLKQYPVDISAKATENGRLTMLAYTRPITSFPLSDEMCASAKAVRLPSSRPERVDICITRPDGGKLYGDLWWPGILRNSAPRFPHSESPFSSSVKSVSASSSGKDSEGIDVHSNDSYYTAGGNPMVVFVHQYSIMGGRGCLLSGIARLLAQRGVPAVTFDLRGVNASSGWKTLAGHKETQDVVAVCSWCVKELKASSIVIVGSSAGAPIGGSAIDCLHEIKGFVGIGYVFGFFASIIFGGHYKNILQSKKPKLLIHGDRDGFTSTSTFLDYFNRTEGPKEMRIIPNVGHFEMEGPVYDSYMASQILEFIEKYLTTGESTRKDEKLTNMMPSTGNGDPPCSPGVKN